MTSPDTAQGPFAGRTPSELLRSAGLGAVDVAVEVTHHRRDDDRHVARLAFVLDEPALDAWLDSSYGPEGGPGRAWVTYTDAAHALGVGEVPNTWLLGREKPVGVPGERYVLIDDASPATVRIALCEPIRDNQW